jgi:hypothetical protein
MFIRQLSQKISNAGVAHMAASSPPMDPIGDNSIVNASLDVDQGKDVAPS